MIWALLIACSVDLGDRSVGAQADRCASCHPNQALALDASRMGHSGESELYQALADEALVELGDRDLCDGCHQPRGEAGLGCVDCHAAIGNRAPHNGELVLDLEGPVLGPTGEADARAAHATEEGGFLQTSELCGTCHTVVGPAGFRESPFAHWEDSPAAGEGTGCADCHMPELRGRVADYDDLAAQTVRDHRFVGLNGDASDGAALLAQAARVSLAVSDGVARATVINDNPGHPLPDGASFLREIALRISLDGAEVARWQLGTELLRGGKPTASPVLADEQVVNAIEPLGERTFEVPVDDGIVTACVVFRPVRTELVDHLGLDPAVAGELLEVACADHFP